MEIRNFRAIKHKTVKANFNVYIPDFGLYLNKMKLISAKNGKFVCAPSESYEQDGETKYFAYYFFEKDKNKKFNEKVMELLKPFMSQIEASTDEAPKQEKPSFEDHQNDLPF